MTSIPVRAGQFKKFVYRSITYPLVLLVIFAAILCWRVVILMNAAQWVDYSDKVITQGNSTVALALEEEAGERGYLVNGSHLFLQRYDQASREMVPALNQLEYMVRRNPPQAANVRRMKLRYQLWQNEIDHLLSLSVTSPDGYKSYFDQGLEDDQMNSLRSEFATFISNENRFREERENTAETATSDTLFSSALLAVAFGLCLGFVWVRQAHEFAGHYEDVLNVSQRNLSLLSATLMSIGDAVLVTDARGKVMQMNDVAERLTGWKFSDAYAMSADRVFRIIDKETRKPLTSPIDRVLTKEELSGIEDQAILIKQGSGEISIEDSCSPIRNEAGRLVGVVLVFRDVTERKRAEEELANLYQREHRIAENLQRSLLSKPDPLLFPALDVETIYQPAWAEAKVGGDYYDIIGLADGRAALIVGDVSGKGLRAASRTAEMKFTLRAYLRENENVGEAVSRLNKFVCQTQSVNDDSDSFFLCLTAIIFDPESGIGYVTVAGMEPPLIVRRDGAVEEVIACGTPVGVFEDSEYRSVKFQTLSGDLLVVATDGITEARKDNEFLGNSGLATLASRCRHLGSLSAVGSSIVDGVKEFADNQLSDDVCLLVARQK